MRTRHASWHESGEDKKHHSKEETPGVIEDLRGLVADVHVQKTNEDSYY